MWFFLDPPSGGQYDGQDDDDILAQLQKEADEDGDDDDDDDDDGDGWNQSSSAPPKASANVDEDEDALNSDDDVNDLIVEDTHNMILCQFEKVTCGGFLWSMADSKCMYLYSFFEQKSKVKDKWKFKFTNGLMHVDGTEYFFKVAEADLMFTGPWNAVM